MATASADVCGKARTIDWGRVCCHASRHARRWLMCGCESEAGGALRGRHSDDSVADRAVLQIKLVSTVAGAQAGDVTADDGARVRVDDVIGGGHHAHSTARPMPRFTVGTIGSGNRRARICPTARDTRVA